MPLIETVYVQKKGGEFINETAFSMWNGCQQMGIHTECFEAQSFEHVQITKETLVHGYVSVVRKALASLGVTPFPVVDGAPPQELLPFYGRRTWPSTMGEIRKYREGDRVFIKPLHQQKAFSGLVVSGAIRDLISTGSFPDDFEVLCSDVVDFVVEYRLFVHHGIIVDCRRYRGDFTKLIDFDVALACVDTYKSAPVAYSLDLGLTKEGRTLVVEVNDAFSLGSYGMGSMTYASMVIDRWEEMVGL